MVSSCANDNYVIITMHSIIILVLYIQQNLRLGTTYDPKWATNLDVHLNIDEYVTLYTGLPCIQFPIFKYQYSGIPASGALFHSNSWYDMPGFVHMWRLFWGSMLTSKLLNPSDTSEFYFWNSMVVIQTFFTNLLWMYPVIFREIVKCAIHRTGIAQYFMNTQFHPLIVDLHQICQTMFRFVCLDYFDSFVPYLFYHVCLTSGNSVDFDMLPPHKIAHGIIMLRWLSVLSAHCPSCGKMRWTLITVAMDT